MYFAAHSATASDRRARLHKVVAWPLIALMIWQPTLALAEVVPVAPDGYRPTLDSAANGIDVMNIANPDANGLSHNLYNRFDVGSDGLVLNNSPNVSLTDLAGHIEGNANLRSGPARVILNEVIQPDASELNGYIEVGGRKADVIVANPWGISCDGCGFINTGRATLTTGTPVIADDGRLQGFNVQGGAVDISGAGINASNIDRFDVITRSLTLNAALHGQEVNLVLGKQQVAYADLAVTDAQTDDEAPTLALDSTALGGIYADRIRLLSSEQGVGVRLSAPIAAQTGNVTLDVNGNLRFNNITSGGDLNVAAVSVQTGEDTADALDETPATTRLLSGGHIDIATDGDAELDNSLLLAGNGINVLAGTDLHAGNSEMRTVRDIELDADDTLHLDANSKLVTNAELSLDARALNGWQQASLNAGHLNVSSMQDLVIDQEMSLRGDATLSTAGTLDISGGIYLPGTLYLNATNLHNSGDVIAYGDLVIAADDATNLGLWYSGGDMVVDIVSSLVNGDAEHAAAMYSSGELVVRDQLDSVVAAESSPESPDSFEPASELINTGSLIQAQGIMTLDVEHIQNLREGEAYDTVAELEVTWPKYGSSDRHERRVWTTTEFIVDEGRGAEIISGGDMTITGAVDNRMSLFFAAGDIDITGRVSNEDLVMQRHIADYLFDWDYKKRMGKKKWKRDKLLRYESRSEDTGEAIFSTFFSSGDIHLNGDLYEKTDDPGSLRPFGLDERQLALVPVKPDVTVVGDVQSGAVINESDLSSLINNALFSVNTDPDHPYLIESRHAFADWQGFHGSEYMLERVGWTADGTVKMLGDEFAELTLARQQIVAMTGRPLISSDYEDEVQQYASLVKNGLYAAESLELSPGVSLTPAQINSLTADIVWPEKKVIAGVEVMVPVLYLVADESSLDVNGAIIAATNIYIEGENIHGTGVMDAQQDIFVDGDVVTLGGNVYAGNQIDVSAESSLTLQSIDMQAEDISLASAGDLTIETYAEHNEHAVGGGKAWETLLGRQAAIDAANSLTITSASDINLYGANLSGHSVQLDAGGSVLLGAVRSSDGLNVKGDNSHLKTDSVRYTVSTINSVLDTLISAEENIKALGADIEAGGDIALYADGDVELLAVMNSDFRYERKALDRAYGSKIKTREDYEEHADVVTLKSGGNVLVNAKVDPRTGKLVTSEEAKGNVVIQGAEIASEETTAVYAGNELYVTAVMEESYHHRETRREYDSWASEAAGAVGAVASAFGPAYTLATGQEASFELKGGHSAGATSQALRDTLFSGAGNTVLLAGEGVTLEAGDYKGDNLFISSGLNEGSTASTQILGLQTTNSQYSTETDYLFGQSQGFASMSTRATEETGRYSADTIWHGTAIDITDNVSINSAGNMILQGTTLEAGGDIDMFAGGGIVFDAGYSSSSYSETLASDANLGEYLNTERNTSRSFAEVTSLSAGGAINITSVGDQIYVGTELQSGDDITLTSHDGAVKFEAARDTASTSYTEQSSDFSWVTMKSEGSYDEVLHMVALQPGGNLVIDAAKGISVDIEKIDDKTGPALIDALVAENPEMAWLKDLADQGEIDWNEVEAVHERWSEEQESLGVGASAVIAIVVSTLTGPAGESVVGALQGAVGTSVTAGTTAAGLGTTAAVASTQAVVSSATTQLVTGTINNGGKLDRAFSDLGGSESLKGLGVSALTAGLTVGIDELFGEYWKAGRLDPSEPVKTNATYGITKGFDLADWRGQLGFTLHSATEGLMNAAVMDAVYGGDFSDYLRDSMESQGYDVLSALAFYKVGDFADGKTEGAGNEGDVSEFLRYVEGGAGRVLLHGVVGGAVTEIASGDFRNGFAAAGLNQLLTPGLNRSLNEISKEKFNWRRAGSQLAGLTGSLLVDGDLNQGSWVALQADSYNRQLHRKEFSLIAENYKEYAKQRGISEERALQELVWAATSLVDAAHAADDGQAWLAQQKQFSFKDAAIFLNTLSLSNGLIRHSDQVVTMPFQATVEQYFDSYVNRHDLRLIEDGFNGELAGLGRQPLLSAYAWDEGAGNYRAALDRARAESGHTKEELFIMGSAFAAPAVMSLSALAGSGLMALAQTSRAYTLGSLGRNYHIVDDVAYGLFGQPGSMAYGYGAVAPGVYGIATQYGDAARGYLGKVGDDVVNFVGRWGDEVGGLGAYGSGLDNAYVSLETRSEAVLDLNFPLSSIREHPFSLLSGGGGASLIRHSGVDVWELDPMVRGRAIESYLTATEYGAWARSDDFLSTSTGRAFKSNNFPLIDFQLGNDVVSLKTVDTNGGRWKYDIRSHIRDLKKADITISGVPARKILDVRVQPGGFNAAVELIEYGRGMEITVLVKEFDGDL